jgi:hypothetical protein
MSFFQDMNKKPYAESAHPTTRTAVTGKESSRAGHPAPEKPYLVVLLDKADESYSYHVVRAEDEDAAERQVVDERKADHDLSSLDDEAAGFQAVLTFSKDDLAEDTREDELAARSCCSPGSQSIVP